MIKILKGRKPYDYLNKYRKMQAIRFNTHSFKK